MNTPLSPALGGELRPVSLGFGAPADVAQLVEHFTRNEGVSGSNPLGGSLSLLLLAARYEPLSCPRIAPASRTDASISTRRIDTLSTLIPNGTPSVRQNSISSVAVVSAWW